MNSTLNFLHTEFILRKNPTNALYMLTQLY